MPTQCDWVMNMFLCVCVSRLHSQTLVVLWVARNSLILIFIITFGAGAYCSGVRCGISTIAIIKFSPNTNTYFIIHTQHFGRSQYSRTELRLIFSGALPLRCGGINFNAAIHSIYYLHIAQCSSARCNNILFYWHCSDNHQLYVISCEWISHRITP